MSKKKGLENKVLKIVRHSNQPPTPEQVVKQVAKKDGSTSVHETIVSLVDRGKLQVTLDWRLRAKE